MAVTEATEPVEPVELEESTGSQREGHRPLMTSGSILMMNVGFSAFNSAA